MSTITWRGARSGDWSFASNWDWGIVPASSDDVLFDLAGLYVVTIDAAAVAQSLVLDAAGATLQQTTGSLTISGDLTVDAGELSLDGANTIGSVDIDDGVLAISSSGALGSASLLMFGGELLANASATLANGLSLDGVDQIAAAAGATLTLTGNAIVNGDNELVFGASNATGAIVWKANAFGLAVSSEANLDVRAGTLMFENFDMGLARPAKLRHP